jgi:hypothetical protein
MCPACLAIAALVVSGTTSTGGLTALAVKIFWSLRAKTFRSEWPNQRRKYHGNEHNETLESGLAGGTASRSQAVSDQGKGIHQAAR